MIRIGSSCAITKQMALGKVVETRRYLNVEVDWIGVAKQAIATKQYLIVTVCINHNNSNYTYPSDYDWIVAVDDTCKKLKSWGGNSNSCRISLVNEPMKYISKEQYAFMFDTSVLEVLPNSYTYDDDGDGNDSNNIDDSIHLNDLFEREPFIVHFKVKSDGFDFVLINIHTKPDDAENEISYLPDVIADVLPHLNEMDVICLGDFNADGSYFDEDIYSTIFPSSQYNWLITNSTDTTVAAIGRLIIPFPGMTANIEIIKIPNSIKSLRISGEIKGLIAFVMCEESRFP